MSTKLAITVVAAIAMASVVSPALAQSFRSHGTDNGYRAYRQNDQMASPRGLYDWNVAPDYSWTYDSIDSSSAQRGDSH